MFLIEPSKVGTQHITLIDGYLTALMSGASIAQSANLVFCASQRTFDSLSPANRSRVSFRSIPVMDPEKRRLVAKSLLEFLVVLRYLIGMRKGDMIFVTCMLPPALMMLEVANRVFRRRGICVLLHGEIEGLFDESKQHIRSFGFWSKRWLLSRRKGSVIRLAVIDDFVKRKLLLEFPDKLLDEQISVVHHPISPMPVGESTDTVGLQACFVGYKTSFKGFDVYERLSASSRIMSFIVVGGGRVESLVDNSVAELPDTKAYLAAIAKCCVAVFPYVAGYSCSLSAAALDALSVGVHIIATDRPCFVSLRDHLGSDSVTICESEHRMAELLQDQDWLNQQTTNRPMRLRRLTESKFGIESVRESFNKLLRSHEESMAEAV